jgi:hypothetical protein
VASYSLEAFWFCYSVLKSPKNIKKIVAKRRKKQKEKKSSNNKEGALCLCFLFVSVVVLCDYLCV